VQCVQEFLLQTAFDPGPADGAWGKRTAAALDAYFSQIGETVDGGLGKDNADAVCALFSGPRRDELLELGAFQIYPVSLDPNAIGDVPGLTEFDFSAFDIATEANFDACTFFMNRRRKADGVVESQQLVAGTVAINSGTLVFGEHKWFTGGLADDTYLSNEANLKLTRSGQVVGKMPYFHMFIDANTQATPANYVTLSTSFVATGNFPSGASDFPGPGMEDGIFNLDCGGTSPPNKTDFDFSKFEIATDANFDRCLFTINQRTKSTGEVDQNPMVDGDLSIHEGKVVIGTHQWHTNGMADETYLAKEANLRVTTSGQVVGMTPYFHMNFEPGEAGQPPVYVELSKGFTARGKFPSGVSEFDDGGDTNDGLLTLLCFPNR
jgi:hypothetical protein